MLLVAGIALVLLIGAGAGAGVLLATNKGSQRKGTSAAASHSATVPLTPSGAMNVFHAPDGNVTCEIGANNAQCSVASADETFVLPAATSAYVQRGRVLSTGDGPIAGYGVSVTRGSITCVIPRANQRRGVTCRDASTGHGFEASRVPARRKTY